METHKRLSLNVPKNHRLYKDYLNFSYDHVEVKNNIYDRNSTFKRCNLPKNYFDELEIGEIIHEFDLSPKIFCIESNHVYNWHRDSFRNIAFNLTINPDTDYIVMFAPDYISSRNEKIIYERIEEIKYDDSKFILFNTQIPHITINRGSTNRYLLTIARYVEGTNSLLNKELDFSEFNKTVNYLEKKQLIEE